MPPFCALGPSDPTHAHSKLHTFPPSPDFAFLCGVLVWGVSHCSRRQYNPNPDIPPPPLAPPASQGIAPQLSDPASAEPMPSPPPRSSLSGDTEYHPTYALFHTLPIENISSPCPPLLKPPPSGVPPTRRWGPSTGLNPLPQVVGQRSRSPPSKIEKKPVSGPPVPHRRLSLPICSAGCPP